MRIWVIGRGFPTKSNNMLGSFEFEQAQMLARHGHEVYYPVIDLRSIRRWRKFGIVKTLEKNINVITLNIPVGPILSSKFRYTLRNQLMKFLFRQVASEFGTPNVIHVHYPCIYPYSMFKQIHDMGAKLVCTEHWTKVQNKTLSDNTVSKEQALSNLLDCVENYDNILCVGEPLRNSIQELTQTRREIIVVPNIVSPLFSYSEKESFNKKDMFRFVGVGRLVDVKRFDLLIRAFVNAFKDCKYVKLDIIGGGPEYNHLKNLIDTCNCKQQVSMLGTMSREEVAKYFHKCHALVMSSNLETFGVPIIEAMASGLPVVTTDAMGFRSLFHKEHGYIVPANDEIALGMGMRQIYENYGFYDHKAISDYAKKVFGEDAVYEKLYSLYLMSAC